MMSSHGPNPISFNNKRLKIGRPKHSLDPNPLSPITSHSCPLPAPQSGRQMCITPCQQYSKCKLVAEITRDFFYMLFLLVL